ncbi:hypothetical protein [Jiangella asiatica]|uniref:DUF4367 domain-containing protein n=1 Tax=Jiangella asiatica TaxID=2530372 RepID=A0A4R5DLU1_9ACTN|nr:hypothetical protein [Jiangella asiatica]TDE15079.1 hypothetical protein E1269_02960 [Jiangella asiatica]
MDDRALTAELRDLGASLEVHGPDPAAVAVAVLDRIATEEAAPAARVPRRRLRARLAAVAVALLVALVLTPPVRAAVGEWLGFGGVVVRPGPSQPSASAPPTASGLTLAQARELVAFEPLQPARLGPPTGVEVSADARLLTMTWGDGAGTVRLDQFDGEPSPMFVKTALLGETAVSIPVGDTTVWWFSEPHDLRMLDGDGREQAHLTRVAGPTLVWVVDGVSLRLEGMDRDESLAVAASTLGTD